MAWVYLPVTSKAVSSEEEAAFYGVCLHRLVKLFALVPILIALALFFTAKEILVLPSILITIIILSAVIMTVDFLRYYLIRRGHKMAAALLVSARWGGGISLVLLLYYLQELTVGNAVVCMLAGNILALVVTALTIKYLQCNIKLVRNAGLDQAITKFSKPLLFQALSGSASSVIVAFAIRSWISTAALGAYQAIRSICNIISPLMQMIGSHYSSYLTRKPDFKQHHIIECLLIILGGVLVCLAWIFKEFIINNTIGTSYLSYSFLLPVVMFHTVIMLAINLVCAHIRRAGHTRIFLYSGIIGLLSSTVLIPTAKYTGSIQMVVCVVVIGTILQFVMLKVVQLR